jgi:hypothetical protein
MIRFKLKFKFEIHLPEFKLVVPKLSFSPWSFFRLLQFFFDLFM